MHKHILICGKVGCGKSTLVKKLIECSNKNISGFISKSMNKSIDGSHQIYLYSPVDDSKKVLVADCKKDSYISYPSSFDSYGVELLSKCQPSDLIIMDEIGFLESQSEAFKSKILDLLNSNTIVIATIKAGHDDCEFLNTVKSHPKVDIYEINEYNRDKLFDQLKSDNWLTDY